MAAINPATIMLAAGIMAMSKKLDAIEENQKRIMDFLQKDKESKLKGNLAFLLNVFRAYRYNWNNSTFRTSQHIKTQDIMQESEQNIVFYRSMLNDALKKKKFLISKLDVKKTLQKIVERGQLDENLIATGERLAEYKDQSIDDLLAALRNINNCHVKQFVDLIETVNKLHNGEPAILVDNQNVYVQIAC